jgi:hypothetical protein
MQMQKTKWGRRGAAAIALTAACTIGLGIATSAAAPRTDAVVHHGAVAVTNWSNTLATNTTGWCTYASGCDGIQSAGTYGTIDVVSHTFSNYGGYAPSVNGPIGQTNSYARVTGSGDYSTGCLVAGVSDPGSENCSGPYTTFGNNSSATVFPAHGFTTSQKIYLSKSWADANPGQVVDWDVALNDNTASYLQDFIFNLCTTSAGGGGFYVSTSSNAGGCSTGPAELLMSGWYTFTENFHPSAGDVAVTYSITNSLGSNALPGQFPVTTNTGHLVAAVGGTAYGWLPDEDILGLPIARTSLTVNS